VDDAGRFPRIGSLPGLAEYHRPGVLSCLHGDRPLDDQPVLPCRDSKPPEKLGAIRPGVFHKNDNVSVGAMSDLVDPELNLWKRFPPRSSQEDPQTVELFIPDLRQGTEHNPDIVNGHGVIIARLQCA